MSKRIEFIQSKIVPVENLTSRISYWRFKEKRIVFTNGCFDIIHRGHIEYLAKAASLGDILIIGINTDSSVKKIKGTDRPMNDQYSRAMVLAAISFVDCVVLFDENTPYQLIDRVKPDVLVKGGDYKEADIVGADIVRSNNGQVVIVDFVDGFSSSNIIKRYNNLS